MKERFGFHGSGKKLRVRLSQRRLLPLATSKNTDLCKISYDPRAVELSREARGPDDHPFTCDWSR